MRQTLTLLLLAATVLVIACSPNSADTTPDATDTETTAVGPRLYVFDCGRLVIHDVSGFGLTREDVETNEMFVPCYLVEHGEGLLLWDGGLAPAVADSENGVSGAAFDQSLDRTLDAQLADLDLTPSDVDMVAFSHMHFDHVGHANLFGGSKLLIQRAEYEAAFAEEPLPVFDASLYSELADSETVLLDGDHDVFGDGSVEILQAPGHTPGHQVLFVDLENTGPVLLSGDLYHFAATRARRAVPSFNTDAEATLASMDKIEAVIEDTGAALWIEHDLPFSRTLRLAPEFYD